MAINECFVCTEKIRSNILTISLKENSDFLLCQILELPHLGNDVQKFSEINYCPGCVDRISNIANMLDELEELERKVLNEKQRIEIQMKKKLTGYGNDDPKIQSVELRANIVAELRANTIQSMMDKIRKKQVGRKLRRRNRIRILKDIVIPRIPNPTNIIDPNVGDFDLSSGHPHSSHIPITPRNLESMLICQAPQSNSTSPIIEDSLNTDSAHELLGQKSSTSENECDVDFKFKYEEIQTSESYVGRQLFDESMEGLDFRHSNWTPWTGDQFGIAENGTVSDNCLKTEVTEDEFQQISEMQGSSSTKAFICGNCEATFDDYNQLKIHDRLHLVKGKRSLSTTTDKINIKQKNPNIRRKYKKSGAQSQLPKKCEECGKILSSKHTWSLHVLTFHRGQFRFKCSVCDYGCQKRDQLMTHMLIHSEEKNFECQFCPSAYKHNATLLAHIKTKHKGGSNRKN